MFSSNCSGHHVCLEAWRCFVTVEDHHAGQHSHFLTTLKDIDSQPHCVWHLFVSHSHRGSCVPRPKCPTSLSRDSDPKARVCHPNGRQWWRWSHISSGNLVGWVLHVAYVCFCLPLSPNGITQDNTWDSTHAHDICFGAVTLSETKVQFPTLNHKYNRPQVSTPWIPATSMQFQGFCISSGFGA